MEETHFCVNRQVKARRKEAGSHLQKKCCTKPEHGVHVTKRKEVKALQKKNQQLQEDDPSNNITAGRLTMKCGIFTKGKTSGLISKGLSTEMQARAEANLARILELANPEEDDQRNVLSPSPDASLPDETTNLNDACPAQCCSHRENVRKSSPQANSKSNASTSKKAKQDKTRGKSRTRVAKTRYARQDIHSSFSGITELVSESEDQKTSRSGSRRSSETDRDLSVSNVQEKKLVVDYQRFLSSIGAKLDESITILEEEGGDVVADTKNNLLNIWKRHGSHRSIPSSTNSASSASCCIGLSVSCDGGSPSVSRTMKRRDKVTSRTNEAVDPLPSALDFSIHPEQVISSPRMLLAKYERKLDHQTYRPHNIEITNKSISAAEFKNSGVPGHFPEDTASNKTAMYDQQLPVSEPNSSTNEHEYSKRMKNDLTISGFSTGDSNSNSSVALVTPLCKGIPPTDPKTVIVNPLTYLKACTKSHPESTEKRISADEEGRRYFKPFQFTHEELMKWQQNSELVNLISKRKVSKTSSSECEMSQPLQHGWKYCDENVCHYSSSYPGTLTGRSTAQVCSVRIPSLLSSSSASKVKYRYKTAVVAQPAANPPYNEIENSQLAGGNCLEASVPECREKIMTWHSTSRGPTRIHSIVKHRGNQNCLACIPHSSNNSAFRECIGDEFKVTHNAVPQFSSGSGYGGSYGITEPINCGCLSCQTSLHEHRVIKPSHFESDCKCKCRGDVAQYVSPQNSSSNSSHVAKHRQSKEDFGPGSSYVTDSSLQHCCPKRESSISVFPYRDHFDPSDQSNQHPQETCTLGCSQLLPFEGHSSSAQLEQAHFSSCGQQPFIQILSSRAAQHADSRKVSAAEHDVHSVYSTGKVPPSEGRLLAGDNLVNWPVGNEPPSTVSVNRGSSAVSACCVRCKTVMKEMSPSF